MTPEVARKVLPLVNAKQNNERLEHYVDWRVSYLHQQLEQCATAEEMKLLQGQLKEVRRLLTLKDEANSAAKDAH